MTWFALALLAALLMTFINFGDKFLIESQIPNPLALIILLSCFNLMVGLVLWGMLGFVILPFTDAFWLIFAGTAPAFAGYFYFQAVSRTETTRIVILSQLTPVFTLVLSMLFLNDRLSLTQIAGFMLILIAAMAVTVQRRQTPVGEVDEPLWDVLLLITITNLIYAVSIVLTDRLLETLVVDVRGLMVVTAYTSFGYWVGGAILFLCVPNVRRAVRISSKTLQLKSLLSLTGVESIFVVRQFVFFGALSLGQASLVSVIGSLNVFFAVIFGWVLTLWQPHIFQEDISRASLLKKFLWAGIAFVGIILVR